MKGLKTGGRKKGTKNLNTQVKEAAQTAAVVKARAAVLAASTRARVDPPPVDKDGLEVAPAGISPKDLMLAAMRSAWSRHKEESVRASGVMSTAVDLIRAATDLSPLESEKADAHRARINAAIEAAHKVRDEANEIRARSERDLSLALECASKAAPYEHAKLQTSTVQGDMTLTVNIKTY